MGKNNLKKFIEGCNTLKEVFSKIKDNKMEIRIEDIGTYTDSFRVIDPRGDFALVAHETDPCVGPVSTNTFLLPYGGSKVYHLMD